ncbi:hypothetical protein [Corallococcus carmarthensis]|nr:hypothetical protein [Corallococcus carmarthensis]
MPELPAAPPGRPGLAQAERQFVRSVVAGLVPACAKILRKPG